jgi:hypothetical protein
MMDKVTVKGKRSALLALVVLILAVIPLSNYAQADRTESSDNKAFLPIVTYTISKGIYGQVSLGNMGPWADVALDLRFFNGAAWSTIASTMTDSDGIYSFKNVPSLQPGQRYYVRYLNTANQAFLYTWHTRPITVYSAGQQVHAGDFNIAGLDLVAPYSGADEDFPVEFSWWLRSGQITDSYELNLFEPQTGSPYFYTDPPLGFVSSYTLPSLPPGFRYDRWYVWNLWVYGPDGDLEGDWGISYWSHFIRFFYVPQGEAASLQAVRTADIVPLLANAGLLPDDIDLDK